jgi:soluble P-type ATPase
MTATAKVKFEVEIMLFQGWGLGCSIEQVRDQAKKEAKAKLIATLEKDQHIKIVGSPEVTMILVPIQ